MRENISEGEPMKTDVRGVDSSECDHSGSRLCFFPEQSKFTELPVIAGTHIAYILIIFGLRNLLKGSKPRKCRLAMGIYNVLQVIAASAIVVGLSPYLLNKVFNINGKFFANIEFCVFIYYCTRIMYMYDSIFMVLRQKGSQLSFLHVYQHTTVGVIWGVILHYGYANGTFSFPIWVNSIIQALIYYHYLWTSYGFKSSLNKYINVIQTLQFSLCMLHAVMVFFLDRQIPAKYAILQFMYNISLLYMYKGFYNQRFQVAKKEAPIRRIEYRKNKEIE